MMDRIAVALMTVGILLAVVATAFMVTHDTVSMFLWGVGTTFVGAVIYLRPR